ncbi:MAG: hypothetical protein AB8H80_03165 [Planctomycetota bacterium]
MRKPSHKLPAAPTEPAGPSWCLWLPAGRAAAASALRDIAGIEALCLPNAIWLRGQSLSAQLRQRLDGIPDGIRYDLEPASRDRAKDGLAHRLRLPGKRLTARKLPIPGAGERWQPLEAASRPVLPPTALPAMAAACDSGIAVEPTPLQLQRSPPTRPAASGIDPAAPNLLRTTLAELHEWVSKAPRARLRGLRFAASRAGEALVHGRPLPPLPGSVWFEQHGVAAPVGYSWRPNAPFDLLAESLGLRPQDLAVFSADGACLRIADSDLVALGRSAVRATLAGPSE